MEYSLVNLLLVAVVAFAIPYGLGFFPKLHVPSAVLEVIAGVMLGPSVLGWIEIDEPVAIVAVIGVAFLLFLGGMELDLTELKGRRARLAAAAFIVSLGLALSVEYAFSAAHLVRTPFFVAVCLSTTTVGIIAPKLKDKGLLDTPAGQYALAGGAVAEFGAIVLLGIFFTKPDSSPIGEAVLLLALGFSALLLLWGLSLLARHVPSRRILLGKRHSSSQIIVRLAMVTLLGGAVVASGFGFEAILGAFLAGMVFAVVMKVWGEEDSFSRKLEGVGYGFFVPTFFVAMGLSLDLSDLHATPFGLGRIIVLLLVLLLARGLPALLYRKELSSTKEVVAVGFLQATNFQFIVVAVAVGTGLDVITEGGAESLIAAGLLSAVIFPGVALRLLRDTRPDSEAVAEAP